MHATRESQVNATNPASDDEAPDLAGMAVVAVLAAAVAGLVIASLPGNVDPVARLARQPCAVAPVVKPAGSAGDRVLDTMARGL